MIWSWLGLLGFSVCEKTSILAMFLPQFDHTGARIPCLDDLTSTYRLSLHQGINRSNRLNSFDIQKA